MILQYFRQKDDNYLITYRVKIHHAKGKYPYRQREKS